MTARGAAAWVLRRIVDVAAILASTWVLVRLLNHITFTPAMTDALVRAAALFDLHGVEDVEDFYLAATLVVSLVPSIALVAGLRRRGRRRAPRRARDERTWRTTDPAG